MYNQSQTKLMKGIFKTKYNRSMKHKLLVRMLGDETLFGDKVGQGSTAKMITK